MAHCDSRVSVHASRMAKALFLPGAGGSSQYWAPVAELLPATMPKCMISWPGLGAEPAIASVRGLDDLVAMVIAEMNEPVDLIAQSMGGLIALKAALAEPDLIRRLVLTATSGGIPVEELGATDWRAAYCVEFPTAAAWIREVREDLSAELHKIHTPTLLLWGSRDRISPIAVGERLQMLLPDAILEVVEGGNHDLAQTHVQATAALIARHLL